MKNVNFIEAVAKLSEGETLYIMQPIDFEASVKDVKTWADDGVLFCFKDSVKEAPEKVEPIDPDDSIDLSEISLEELEEMVEQHEVAPDPEPKKNGRKRMIDHDEVFKLKDNGWAVVDIANKFGCRVTSIYKILSGRSKS